MKLGLGTVQFGQAYGVSNTRGRVPPAEAAAILQKLDPEEVRQLGKAMFAVADVSEREVEDVLDDFAGFYFDIALSGSPAALPSLLAFAKPGHVLFGSDFPFAPPVAVQYFTATGDAYADADHAAINRGNALPLFPRLAKAVAS